MMRCGYRLGSWRYRHRAEPPRHLHPAGRQLHHHLGELQLRLHLDQPPPPRPTPKLSLERSPDRYKGNKGRREEQPRTPQSGRKRAHRQPRGSLVQLRSPACHWGLSRSSLPVGRWSLDFLCPEPSHACAELRPSHQIAVPEMRFPNPSSTGYCPPSSVPRLETLPVPGRLGPTAALPRRPPALSLGDFCFDPSTADVG